MATITTARITSIALLAVLGCGEQSTGVPAKPAQQAKPTESTKSQPTSAEVAASSNTPDHLPYKEALELAMKKYPELVPIEVELETKDGTPLLEVEFLKGDGVYEVYMAPKPARS